MNTYKVENGVMVESDICAARLAFEYGRLRSNVHGTSGPVVVSEHGRSDDDAFHVVDPDGSVRASSVSIDAARTLRDAVS